MTENTQFNARLPKITHDEINDIAKEYGLTKTQIIILAVDRLTRDLCPGKYGDDGAKTEAYLLSDNHDESGYVEQA